MERVGRLRVCHDLDDFYLATLYSTLENLYEPADTLKVYTMLDPSKHILVCGIDFRDVELLLNDELLGLNARSTLC